MLDITKLEPSQLKATFTDKKITHIVAAQNPMNSFCEVVVIFEDGRVTTCKKDGTDGSIPLFTARGGLGFKYSENKLQQFAELIDVATDILNRYNPGPHNGGGWQLITSRGPCFLSELKQFIDDVAKDIANRKE